MNSPDHFSLLGLPRQTDLDPLALEANWKSRAASVHPDRFATASDAQKRVAMQWSAQINEAYRVLKDPLRRAQYLCELAGIDAAARESVALDPGFLMQQMQWREQLEDIRDCKDVHALNDLISEIQIERDRYERQTSLLIDKLSWSDVTKNIHEWMFIEKFLTELTTVKRMLGDTEN